MPEGFSTDLPELSVSEFVELHNQILEYAMPTVVVVGELSSFRVSKNRWVYFDLKDEASSVKFFATVYQLPGPLEDGMLLKVRGTPRLHPQFGFSINITSIQLAGEGTLRKAAELLQQKLAKEGLFDAERKRPLPYPPQHLGIITSKTSAAYADVSKILNARWNNLAITLADVQLQGEPAPAQIAAAIAEFNQLAQPPEVLLITRGGGSLEDLAAFSTELVTRAVAASRIPTMVAIGHEVDTSLAELAADVRASTPSNAAELLVPDAKHERLQLRASRREMRSLVQQALKQQRGNVQAQRDSLERSMEHVFEQAQTSLENRKRIIELLSPHAVLRRGYAIVRDSVGGVVRTSAAAKLADGLAIEFSDGTIKVIKDQ